MIAKDKSRRELKGGDAQYEMRGEWWVKWWRDDSARGLK